ncbi:MAG TPA: tRNA epoxyqueuosine(34) reductase QueG [Gemmatimonadaceae bacterium]
MGRSPVTTTRPVPDAGRIKAQAYALGFDLAGIARLGPSGTFPAFEKWLDRGMAGEMQWLKRDAALRRDTRLPHRGARSAIVVALDYGGREPAGTLARYARGRDYHAVMKERLYALLRWLETEGGSRVAGRPYVDTGPILERDLARLAGLGWFGKNTMLIHPRRGSFLFLGALFVDVELEPDAPFSEEHCGTCRRCIDACPTAAIAEEGVLDATRCISYLTIEKRGAIPVEWRESIGTLVYGCDICQDVCPWNVRFAREARDPDLATGSLEASPDPITLLQMDADGFQRRFGGTAVTRAGRQGLSRNAAVALGNRGAAGDVEALAECLAREPDPVVRSHAAWALGSIGTPEALHVLRARVAEERDEMVLNEIAVAIEGRGSGLEGRERVESEG